MIAQVTKTAIAVLVTGKFETLGSNFSHETVGLAIQNKSFIFLRPLPHTNEVVRQILLVRNHRQDFLYAKKRNPSYD